MYKFAILIGLFSYAIFAVGIFGWLSRPTIGVMAVIFIIGFIALIKTTSVNGRDISVWFSKRIFVEKIFIVLLITLSVTNLIGVLGPELSFDALWYHLTLPKIFIEHQQISHIPGGLLYYSDMPKLIEMLYVPALIFGNEVVAKLIHFTFGIGALFVVYKIARKFLSPRWSLFACLIFYSNLVIDWLSITAYIDLGRAFFEAASVYYLVTYFEKKKVTTLLISAAMLGLAISSKVLSAVDLLIFIPVILLNTRSIKNSLIFVFTSLLIPLPWFIFSYVNTRNPFYPFFSNLYRIAPDLNFLNIINFIHSADPISPIYLITFPLIFFVYKKFNTYGRLLLVYCLVSFCVWYITPQSGGGRFFVAYLPVFSVVAAMIISYLKDNRIQKYLVFVVLFLSIVSIFYRGFANYKYIPVIIGNESRDKFLSRNLNFSYGDFYDTDGYFKNNIKQGDKVLTVGLHNLYYVDFPYIDETWVRWNDYYDYILTQNVALPAKYGNLKQIYDNNVTHVKLYKK